AAPSAVQHTTLKKRIAWISAFAVVALTAIAIIMVVGSRPSSPEMRLEITALPVINPELLDSLAISPDGQKIVFMGTVSGETRLWLRSLSSPSPRALAGTDNADSPFWSPDSRSIGFFADRKLKRIDIDGGSPQVLADAPLGRGGTWNRDGVIL